MAVGWGRGKLCTGEQKVCRNENEKRSSGEGVKLGKGNT